MLKFTSQRACLCGDVAFGLVSKRCKLSRSTQRVCDRAHGPHRQTRTVYVLVSGTTPSSSLRWGMSGLTPSDPFS
eukprot:364782-Chlamydomonas_euryale.AAC.17